ncbi:MAG TPA: LamG domain-containing protein, partial [Candidatus Sulfotelmatobacter sp.]|nr:LamG domain-containing protein [Candidatus Sulfotelmatobacter sp.]
MRNFFPAPWFLMQVGIVFIALVTSTPSHAQATNDPPFYGPFNAVFLPDGDGLKKPLEKTDSLLRADSRWSIYAWVKPTETQRMPSLVAGLGAPDEEFPRFLALSSDHLMFYMGKDNVLFANASLAAEKWHFIAATFDGEQLRLYADGASVASGKLDAGSVSPVLEMAPPSLPSPNWRHFGGFIASLTVLRDALSNDEIKQLFQKPDDFSNREFEEGSKPWP